MKTVLSDQSLWVTLSAFVAAVLAATGLGHLAPEVQAVIAAGAGLVSTVYVGGKAHVTATTNKTAPAAGPAVADVAAVASKAAAQVIDAMRKATATP